MGPKNCDSTEESLLRVERCSPRGAPRKPVWCAGEEPKNTSAVSGQFILPPSRWTQSQTSLAERRVIPYSSEVHGRFQNYSYEFGCQARATHRWLLEYRRVKRFFWHLSDSWTGFTQFTLLVEEPPDGYMWSGERLTGQAADAVSACTQVKMEDVPKVLKISKSECPDIWIRLPRHKWPKSWSSIEDPVVPLERNLYGHPLEGLLWERQFEKILLKHGWEKVSNWECLLVQREKGFFLLCVCGWHQIGWKETKHWSDVENTQLRSWCGRFNIFPGSWKLGLHSKTMWNKQIYCGQLQSHVWIANFRGENWKTSIV